MIELIVRDKFQITGRGTVFTGSLSENGLENSDNLMGEKFIHDEITYEITGIEHFRKSFGRIGDNFGILVKEDNGENKTT